MDFHFSKELMMKISLSKIFVDIYHPLFGGHNIITEHMKPEGTNLLEYQNLMLAVVLRRLWLIMMN